eukprot:25231-Chlamydomonas_euryale.AAC.1
MSVSSSERCAQGVRHPLSIKTRCSPPPAKHTSAFAHQRSHTNTRPPPLSHTHMSSSAAAPQRCARHPRLMHEAVRRQRSHTHAHTHTYTHTHARTRTRTHAHTHARTRTHIRAHTHSRTCPPHTPTPAALHWHPRRWAFHPSLVHEAVRRSEQL